MTEGLPVPNQAAVLDRKSWWDTGQFCPLGLSDILEPSKITWLTSLAQEEARVWNFHLHCTLALQGSASPCFLNAEFLYADHNTKHVCVCYKTPNALYSVARFAGSSTWLLGSGRRASTPCCLGSLPCKCTHHPARVKATLCQLVSASSCCKKSIDTIRSKWLQKLQSDSKQTFNCFSAI